MLDVQHLSKKFCRALKRSMYYGLRDIAVELVGGDRSGRTLRPGEFWALKDVSFQLRRGDAIGLVGRNGAGKTTLLRLISGLIRLDSGSIRIRGHLAPLLALRGGFNVALSGRENIYVNMSILGLSKKQIDERYDAVVDFAGIGDAIEAPVQTYSTGMGARLGFSCAIHTEPDILLIDEVLAVGDAEFRAKCYRRLAQLREKGTSFVLVSHSPAAIVSICDTAIYLSKGRSVLNDVTDRVISRYEEDITSGHAPLVQASGQLILRNKAGPSGLQITYVGFRDGDGRSLDALTSGVPASLRVGCEVHEPLRKVNLGIVIDELSEDRTRVLFLESVRDGKVFDLAPGPQAIELRMSPCGLKPGAYTAKVYLKHGKFHVFDMVDSFVFKVQPNKSMVQCEFFQPRAWDISPSEAVLQSTQEAAPTS